MRSAGWNLNIKSLLLVVFFIPEDSRIILFANVAWQCLQQKAVK